MGKKPVKVHVNKYAREIDPDERRPLSLEHGGGQLIGQREKEILNKKQNQLNAFRVALGIASIGYGPEYTVGAIRVPGEEEAIRTGRNIVKTHELDGTNVVLNFLVFLQKEAPEVYRGLINEARKKFPDLNKPRPRENYKAEIIRLTRALMSEKGIFRMLRA